MFKKGLALVATTLVAFGGVAAVDSLPASAQKVDGAPVNATFTIDQGFLQINDDSFEAGSAEEPVIATGTVAPNGTISNINITFPPLDPIVITDPINATLTVTIVIVGTPTGSIDPITGAASLNFQVDIRVTGSPLSNGCHVGPISITSGTGEVAGVPYDPNTGTATLADHNFFVPGAQGCTAFGIVDVNGDINAELGLPTSNTHASFTAHVSPVLQAAIRPSFTATPSSGFAPLAVDFDASATYVARPSATYAWDLDNDGAFDDAVGITPSAIYAAGTHTVRLRVTDDQGDFAIATRVVTAVEPSPDLAVSIDDGGSSFITGQPGSYTIGVDNIGSAATTGDTTVVATLPSDMTFVAAGGAGWSCVEALLVVTCTHSGLVDDGDSFGDITIDVTAGTTPGPISATATVSTAGDLNPANDTATDPGLVIQAGIDLVIDKTHDLTDGLFRGERATYTLSVSNAGTASADTRIRVSDTLPTGTSFVSASGIGWVCSQLSGTVSCFTDADAGPGATLPPVNIRVDVAGDAPASLSNTGTVTVDGDANSANNSDTDTGDVLGLGVDYDVDKAHLGDLVRGEQAVYSIGVTNVGTATGGADVVVTDLLPAGLTFVSAVGDGWTCDSTVTCTHAGNVEPGDLLPKITLRVLVGADAGASITNSATVTAAGDGNSENDSASDEGAVRDPQPDLEITKGHVGNLTQGSTGSYSINVKNVAAERTDGPIQVVDTLPAPLTFVSASGPGWSCSAVGQVVTCDRTGVLAGGDTAGKITIVVSAPDNAPAIVTNTATVSSPGDTNPANDTASDPTRIDPRTPAPTAIMAEAIVLRLDLKFVGGKLVSQVALIAAPRATLTNAVTHAPIPGKPIVFRTSSGVHICTATTNGNGLAVCDPYNLQNLLSALVGLRYSATFVGDLDYQLSTTEGAILQINGIRLL